MSKLFREKTAGGFRFRETMTASPLTTPPPETTGTRAHHPTPAGSSRVETQDAWTAQLQKPLGNIWRHPWFLPGAGSAKNRQLLRVPSRNFQPPGAAHPGTLSPQATQYYNIHIYVR